MLSHYYATDGVLLSKDGTKLIHYPAKKSDRAYTIPNGVTWIGSGAFRNCTSLESVSIPGSVTDINDAAFSGCSSLTSVTIPAGVTTLGDTAFADCGSLSDIRVNDRNGSFISDKGVLLSRDGTQLLQYPAGKADSKYTIPGNVTDIHPAAFNGCVNLTSVTIPASVTSIGVSSFDSCDKLTTFLVDSGNTTYSSVDGVLFTRDSTMLTRYPTGRKDSTYTVPKIADAIDSWAFSGCTSLTEMKIPENVVYIGSSAFADCTSLVSVEIPEGVTQISENAFYGCTGLTDVAIPKGLKSIYEEAFQGCVSLTDVYYGGSEQDLEELNSVSDLRILSAAVIHYNTGRLPA